MIFYYSGCGNSRWAAQALGKALNDELRFIPDLRQAGFSDYEAQAGESVGFVFPIYAWAAPTLVEDFIKHVKWQVPVDTYIYTVVTCGDETGTTSRAFARLLQENGLHQDAFYTFQMPETYLFFPGFKLDNKENEQCKLHAAAEKMPRVVEQIRRKTRTVDELQGKLPGLKSGLVKWLFLHLLISDKHFRTTDACIGCGLCARVCPLKNIEMRPSQSPKGDEKRPRWGGNCTQCSACYHHCPQNAIQFGQLTEGKGQYHHK